MIKVILFLFGIMINFISFSQQTKTKAKQPTTSKPAVYTPKKAPATATSAPKTATVAKPTPAPEKPKQQTTVYKPVAKQVNKPTISYSKGGGYNQGDKLLNIGVGLSSYYSYSNPIGLSYEVGSHPNLSIGGQFDYVSSNNNYYNEGFSSFYLGGRASYHVNEILKIRDEKIDLYAGVGLGYRSFRWKDSSYYYSGYNSGLFFNYFVGGKYYFSGKFGAFAELGYTGLSSSRIGITFKL